MGGCLDVFCSQSKVNGLVLLGQLSSVVAHLQPFILAAFSDWLIGVDLPAFLSCAFGRGAHTERFFYPSWH